MRTRGNVEDGQSSVETALACTVLLMVVIGVMQTGLALYSYHFTAEAARLGTRYAMVRGSSCAGFTSACPAAAADVQNYIRGLGYVGVQSSNVTATTTWPTTGSSCSPSSSPCNNPGNLVKVVVQYKWTYGIPWVSKKIAWNVSSTSQMVIVQ